MLAHHLSFYLSIKARDGGIVSDAYEIRLQGHLDRRWATWFDGLNLTVEPDGTTLISGHVADQAALHGLLDKVRDLGLPLISVTRQPQAGTPYPDGTSTHARRTP